MDIKPLTPRRPVGSGSFAVSGKQHEILEAYLGTCVGVAIFDSCSKVGGLIHLLLPEPTGVGEVWQPDGYATTGMPRFIQALCDAGASRGRLEAYVAGGALVGPICERDLALDIGGRTAEIVERILRQEGIPIRRTETGGFFTCRLILNSETWEVHIEPLDISPGTASREEFKKPTQKQLDEATDGLRPIPQIALKIIRMIQDHRHSLQDMAKEVRQDQVVSAKVIRLCNTPFFSMKMKIASIDRALVMLGEKHFLQLVVSASLEDFFPEDGLGYSLCKGGLYNHALGAAMIAETLANITGKASADIAYTAGLLHDVGKVVLDQYIAHAHPFFYRRTQVDGIDLVVVEREVFGITHTEVGSRLAERWSLPENLADAIRHHHCPEEATVNPDLTHLVYLADLLMSRFLAGQELERLNTDKLTSRMKKVGLESEQFPIMVDSIPRQMFEGASSGNIY
ncbi:MAG: HDOD domain-containing protein [Deltaproteobacteria bacterium]|nr:HDOD domain-containing protein [Deltaproteobacteria bacterium]MBW1861227.1 HDOD domain-containing protein [Deltaproteobacteria bacterium]